VNVLKINDIHFVTVHGHWTGNVSTEQQSDVQKKKEKCRVERSQADSAFPSSTVFPSSLTLTWFALHSSV